MSKNNTNVINANADQLPLPHNPNFPDGLRVLLVDGSLASLQITSAMLEQCKYHVTPVTNAPEALALLRMNKDDYDIVMTDVKMPDMDGFELLKIIGDEMDIPVILFSAESSREDVMKGVRLGAEVYLVKPLRILELQNIWQHVMRRIVLNPEKTDFPLKKRRSKGKDKEDVNAASDNAPVKKPRFAWTKELHKKFVETVHQLDAEKAVPKQIVEIMNEPGLTREIVASHLQKYRNYLKREQEKIAAEERNFYGGQRGTHEAYFTPTQTLHSDCNVHPMFREASIGGSSGSGMLSFHGRLPEPEPLSNPPVNEDFMIDSFNQQSLWSKHNYSSPQIPNQAPKPISVLGNPPLAQSWGTNPSATAMFGDYNVDMSSEIPNMGAVQSGPPLGFANLAGQSGHSGFPPGILPSTEHASHSGPPDVFGIAGAPYQMLDGASTQMSHPFQHNALPGKNDGRVISAASFYGGVGSAVSFDGGVGSAASFDRGVGSAASFNGGVGSAASFDGGVGSAASFHGGVGSAASFNGGVGSDGRGYPVDQSRVNGPGEYTKLLTGTMDSSNLYNSLSSMDDEIFTQEQQSGPTSAPTRRY